MTTRRCRIVYIAILSSLITGCASIVSDSSYPVIIQTSPVGASFSITDNRGVTIHNGATPSTVTLKSGDGYFSGAKYTINFEKPGHTPTTVVVDSTMDGWYIGNLLFGGLIGMLIIDPATGAMWKLPEIASATLPMQIDPDGQKNVQLKVQTIEQVPSELRDDLIRVN